MDRNVTHSYNQNIALSIISQAKEKFYDMFCQLKKEIDENLDIKIRQTQKCNAGFFICYIIMNMYHGYPIPKLPQQSP